MSYTYRILNDRPRHFYPLVAGTLAWNDATGRADAEVLGAPTIAPPLVVGGGNSYEMNGNDNMRFASDVFFENPVSRPFTLEAWFKPVSITGTKGIVGHLGSTDGITYDGEKISFATVHGEAGEARASWFPPADFTSYHVLGVHTEDRNELYVNGVRVASVDLTTEQLMYGYEITSAPGFLYAGHRPGTIIVDAVAVYAAALTSRQAKLHFLWGRDAPHLQEVVSRRGGNYWTFTDDTADVAFDFRFDTDAEWLDAQSASVRVFNDILIPEIGADDTTVEGTWIAGFILPAITDAVDGSKIEFDGDGNYEVYTSVDDGTTWSPAVNGREITGLSTGAAIDDKSLQIRVTFPAGEPLDTITKLRYLSVKTYRDRDSTGTIGEAPVVFTGKAALTSDVRQPIEHPDRMGVELYSGGYGTIDSLVNTRSLEFWVKAGNDTAFTLFDGAGTGTTYVNGVEQAESYVPGRWYHVVFVADAAITGPVTINPGGNGQIHVGFLGTYSNALTAAEAEDLYNAYLGIPNRVVVEPTGLSIVDAPTETVKIYSFDWSNVASG